MGSFVNRFQKESDDDRLKRKMAIIGSGCGCSDGRLCRHARCQNKNAAHLLTGPDYIAPDTVAEL